LKTKGIRLQIDVRPLTAERLPAYLAFFDRDAFMDNPEWAACYCTYYHARHDLKPWEERTAAENRSLAQGLIQSGRLHGHLAYLGDRVVGWCQAAPKIEIPNLVGHETIRGDDDKKVGAIVCFVVGPSERRKGVAAALLAAACDGFRELGLTAAEGYPRSGATADAPNYHGPLSMYLHQGFVVYRQYDEFWIVRKALV
jgi:GNAT superfamily N-acetyltransferase